MNSDTEEKQGQIAHLDRDRANNDPENLVFLCLLHHDSYDSKRSQSKNMTPREVRRHRDRLYRWVHDNLPSQAASDDALAALMPRHSSAQPSQARQPSHRTLIDPRQLAGEWGLPLEEVNEELGRAARLMGRLQDARLTAGQRRLLELIILEHNPEGLPRRVVEGRAGFEYMSSEFFDEMSVLVHARLVTHEPELDNHIYLEDSHTWETIRGLCEYIGLPLADVLRQPALLKLEA